MTTEIITSDRRMRELIQLAKTVAGSKATVLIQGESGTGKELMASLVHENSHPRQPTLRGDQLRRDPGKPARERAFRLRARRLYRRGRGKAGKFEFANGGTLLAGRDLRDGHSPPGQASARDPGRGGGPHRRPQADRRRRPHHRHHQPQSGRMREGRHLPRGSLLPPQRRQPDLAAVARTVGGRPDRFTAFHGPVRRQKRQASSADLHARSDGHARSAMCGRATSASSRT